MASEQQHPVLQRLAIPAVSCLIVFLAYTSQYLFHHIEPGPLSTKEAAWFNTFVGAIWWTYYKACTVDPGRKGWVEAALSSKQHQDASEGQRRRWCKKCDAVKPPRAHHCKQCKRCIPKMDHHCPWTTNCVSHTTFPHFIRFVTYTVLSMSLLAYHLLTRCYLIWERRALPSYLGPPAWAMVHLLVLTTVNGVTLLALGILLVRALYSLATNTSMIEEWEIERHEALVARARRTGGIVYGSGGQRVRVTRQEFPYDVGVWRNLCQGMGTGNVLLWVWPFAGGPAVESALAWEENGFEDVGTVWPPLDPDKMPRGRRRGEEQTEGMVAGFENEGQVEAFKKRQREDMRRWEKSGRIVAAVEESDEYESDAVEDDLDDIGDWANSDGDRLRDFGVDEDAEAYTDEDDDDDDDDVPLGELLRRRKARMYEQ